MTAAAGLLCLFAWACSSDDPTTPADAALSDGAAADQRTDGGGYTMAVVASYHAEATRAGIAMLKKGGNAFDAFVAATAVEYVVHPGYTSLGGPMAAMVYRADTGKIESLDAGFNTIIAADGVWQPGAPDGKGVLVPGAAAGLEAISRRHGKLGLATALAPAVTLAREGFVVSQFYSGYVQLAATTLARSAYGKATFLPGGKPIQAGTLLKQPALAGLLTSLSKEGAKHVYTGAWGARLVKLVAQQGGKLTAADLTAYKVRWRAPRSVTYRGHVLYTHPGRIFGGLSNLFSLKVLEHADTRGLAHFSNDADALEVMVRIARTRANETWLRDYKTLDDSDKIKDALSNGYTDAVWKLVYASLSPSARGALGSHSSHVAVIDTAGNAITGINTINSAQPWGDGLFVDGVALSNAGKATWQNTAPGERRIAAFLQHLGFKEGKLAFAAGTFSASMIPAGFQLLVNLVDYGYPAKRAASLPRFGTFPFDPTSGAVDTTKNLLDVKVSQTIVSTLAKRGLYFKQEQYADTGLGVIVTADPNTRTLEGATTPYFIDSTGYVQTYRP
jgi:gamma-glutamyltranspeptidase/glutathione hydrolase